MHHLCAAAAERLDSELFGLDRPGGPAAERLARRAAVRVPRVPVPEDQGAPAGGDGQRVDAPQLAATREVRPTHDQAAHCAGRGGPRGALECLRAPLV